MATAGSEEFKRRHGFLSYLHYLIFPLDLFGQDEPHFIASREQRISELTPIMVWLIPLILVFSGFTELNTIGLILLMLIEIIILTILSIIYCWRASLGFIFETGVNYAISFFLLGIFFFFIVGILGAFTGEMDGECCFMIIILPIAIIAGLFKNRGGGYYNDDDDW